MPSGHFEGHDLPLRICREGRFRRQSTSERSSCRRRLGGRTEATVAARDAGWCGSGPRRVPPSIDSAGRPGPYSPAFRVTHSGPRGFRRRRRRGGVRGGSGAQSVRAVPHRSPCAASAWCLCSRTSRRRRWWPRRGKICWRWRTSTTSTWKVGGALREGYATALTAPLPAGACEGSIACSTCHVILEDDVFESLPEACEEEEDMLDLAFGLTPTFVARDPCPAPAPRLTASRPQVEAGLPGPGEQGHRGHEGAQRGLPPKGSASPRPARRSSCPRRRATCT